MTGSRRRWAGAVLALAVAGGVAVATPAWAATSTAGTAATAAITVAIDEVTPSVLHPGEDLTVTAVVRNDGPADVDGIRAALRLNRFRPASRAELDDWVSGTGGAVGTRVAVGQPVALPAGGSTTVTLTVAARDVRLLDLPGTWGPRGLAVEVLDDRGTQLTVQRTFALWMRDEAVPQVRVSIIAPVTGSPGDAGLGDDVGPGGRLRDLVDLAAVEPDLDLAVDPALLADAADGGGAQEAQWAADLAAALPLRVGFALPYGDADVAAIAHADRPSLLTTALDLSDATGLAGRPARTDLLWAPDGSLDQVTADAVAAAGASAIVVGTGTLQATDGVTTARADLTTANGTIAALVPDRLLTRLFVAPEPGETTATTVQRLLAEVAVIAHDGSADPRHVLIAPGRDWEPDADLVEALLSALRTSPWSRLVPVSTLLGASDDGSARDPLPQHTVAAGEMAPDDVRALADSWDETTAFAAAIGGADTLTAGLERRVLAPLSVAWRADGAERSALVRDLVADTAAARDGLSLNPPPGLNVISASAPVRFVVRNDLPIPATVAVQVSPRKACLRPARSEPVRLEPGTDTPVVVDLEAAANCDVAVDATLVGENGTPVGDSVRFDARVAPTIESVGTVVVAALLAVGLVLGLVRTVRRGRSARRGGVPKDEA